MMLGSALVDISCDDVYLAQQAYDRLLGTSADRSPSVSNGRLNLSDVPGSPHRALFSTTDYDATTRLLRRRGLPLRDSGPGRAEASDQPSVGVISDTELALAPAQSEITSIDHLVFNAATRDNAVALFGGTLGLDFRLEQSMHDDIHQLFFRSSTIVVEVVVGQPDESGRSAESVPSLWGIAWRSLDIEKTRRRLSDDGLSLSEIRVGRKPGTSVFTIRESAFGLPTLVLG